MVKTYEFTLDEVELTMRSSKMVSQVTPPVSGHLYATASPSQPHPRVALPSVQLTPERPRRRVTLRRLTSDPAARGGDPGRARRAHAADVIAGRVPRVVLEFGDRLEAMFSPEQVGGDPGRWEGPTVAAPAAGRDGGGERAEADAVDEETAHRTGSDRIQALWLANGLECAKTQAKAAETHSSVDRRAVFAGDRGNDCTPRTPFSIYETPRRAFHDGVFVRPTRPHVQCKRHAVTGSCQSRGSEPANHSSRTEKQKSDKRHSSNAAAAVASAVETPRRQRPELKPAFLTNRWQAGRTDTPRRHRSEREAAASNDRYQNVPETATHRRRSDLQLSPAADRWRGNAAESPSRRCDAALQSPPVAARCRDDSPRILTDVVLRPLAPSPGGAGDRLRRVERWLETSQSVVDPTKRRRLDRTPGPACRSHGPAPAPSVTSKGRPRRPRVEYTAQEVHNLLRGVQKYGRDFKAIRLVYDFHPSRTTVDLYDKYRHMRPVRPAAAGRGPHRLMPGGDSLPQKNLEGGW